MTTIMETRRIIEEYCDPSATLTGTEDAAEVLAYFQAMGLPGDSPLTLTEAEVQLYLNTLAINGR